MCPESFRKKFEFYDMEIPNMPREPRPSWGNKIHFCRFLPFLPSAGAMTAATTAPSGHASAVQPPGRHVERRAWSWSGPLHLPWPSRALKMAKMWSDFGPAAALRGLGGGHDGFAPKTPQAARNRQRDILETTWDQSCTLMGLKRGQNGLSRFEGLRGRL